MVNVLLQDESYSLSILERKYAAAMWQDEHYNLNCSITKKSKLEHSATSFETTQPLLPNYLPQHDDIVIMGDLVLPHPVSWFAPGCD